MASAVSPARPVARSSVWGLQWLLACVLGVALSALTANPGLTAAATASLAAIVALLWRKGLPPALPLIFGTQWLQGSGLILHADVLGVDIAELSYAYHIERAAYLTLLWVVCLAVGAALAIRGVMPRDDRPLEYRADLKPLLWLYTSWTIASAVLELLPHGGLGEAASAFQRLRGSVIFAIFIAGLARRRTHPVVWLVFAGELLAGFFSFFSEFKQPLFLMLVALATGLYSLSARHKALLVSVVCLTLCLGAIWSSIKPRYRQELNKGTGQQAVLIDTAEQASLLVDLVAEVDRQHLSEGLDRLVTRVAYIQYFAYALDYVPSIVRHENGRLWLGAVRHVLMPRLFFPHKPPLISDTVTTERYTGLRLAHHGAQTSISLGVPALTYVDFGPVFMFIVALLMGGIHGLCYRFFVVQREMRPLAAGFAVAVVLGHLSLGSATTKLFGGQLASFLVAVLMWRSLSFVLRRRASATR